MLGKGCRSARACAADMTAATDSARTDAAAQGRRTQSCSAVVLQDTKSTHSSALRASCRAPASAAARVRPGAPSAQTFGLLRRAPLGESIACTERRFHTCARAAGEKISTDGQEAHSKLKKEVKKGSGSVRMARSIIPAMPRATGLACGNARIGHGTRRVELQCHSSWPVAAVYLHTAAAAISVQAAAAAIAAAPAAVISASSASVGCLGLSSAMGLLR